MYACRDFTGRTKSMYTVQGFPLKNCMSASAMRMRGSCVLGTEGQGVEALNFTSAFRRRLRRVGSFMRVRGDLFSRYAGIAKGGMRRASRPRFFFHTRHVFKHRVHCRRRLPKRLTFSWQQGDFSCNCFIHEKLSHKTFNVCLQRSKKRTNFQPNFFTYAAIAVLSDILLSRKD